jgi:hypothetical protein
VKLLKQPGKLKKQKKFAAPFIGPLIIDKCVHKDIYRLRSMDGKKLKGRAVNIERIFPYHTDHEEHVEAPRASGLVADKEPPEPAVQPTGHPDGDSESLGGEPELEMGVPSHSGGTLADQTAEEDSMQGLQAAGSSDATTGWADGQAIADEPEQQTEAQEPATESDGDQRATSDQDQPPEAISESEAAPAPGTEQTTPAEPEPQQTATEQEQSVRRSTREKRPPKQLNQDLGFLKKLATRRGTNAGIFTQFPWRLRGRGSSVTTAV